MDSLLDQLKARRQELGLKQHDMMLRVGMSRQQYQRLESRGNPRLDTLELVAKGLRSELVLVPQEKLQAVLALLEDTHNDGNLPSNKQQTSEKPLSDDPWQGLLEDTE